MRAQAGLTRSGSLFMMRHMRLILICSCAFAWHTCTAFADSASPDLYGGDSDNIDAMIAAATEPGASRQVTLGKNPYRADGTWMITRAILLPDDFTLVLDDCRVELAPGTRDNLIRNAGALGFRRVTPNRGIRVLGKGNAVLCGGKANHFAPMRSGDWNGWQAMGILLCAVTDYELAGFTLEETQCWGITQENGCARGWIHDITFADSNKMRNQDGIDVRKGCHDITIENISGVCGDDVVALTALRHRPGEMRTNGRSSCQIGGSDPVDGDDVYNIKVRNIRAKCSGGHGIIRLLAQDGVQMHHITVSNVVETAGTDDPRSQATIRIGDTNYWTLRRNAMGDMRHITVRDVTSTAKAGVWVKGLLCDSEIADIRVAPDAKRYDVTLQTECVTFGDAEP